MTRPSTPPAAARACRCDRRSAAYTLLEMLIALIMFALISVATGFMMTAAMRGQDQLGKRTSEAQEVRTLMGLLARDLRSAYVVTGSPSTYLVASGADSGPILQFTTLASRLMPDLSAAATDPAEDGVTPQSGIVQVTYDYDPETHVLSRLASSLPGVETLPEAGGPEWIVSRRVTLLAFTFVDAEGNTRSEWNFQTPEATDGTTQTDPSAYDTTLPVRVDVELELERSSGETVVFHTSIALENATPQPAGQTPPQPAATPGAGGAGGGGGGGAPAP